MIGKKRKIIDIMDKIEDRKMDLVEKKINEGKYLMKKRMIERG